jgi:aminocarboxymuconate-semialdehyde decarboxylase
VLERCLERGLRGISVATIVAGRELADPAHDPVWAAAEAAAAIVLVHPWGCSLGERLATRYLGNTVGSRWRPRWRCRT